MSKKFSTQGARGTAAAMKHRWVGEVTLFVLQGLTGSSAAAPRTVLAAVTNGIRMSLLDSYMQSREYSDNLEPVCERLLEEFFEEYEENCRLYLRESVPPMAVSDWPEERWAIQQRYGAEVAYVSPEPNLDGALDLSWRNLRRAQQRYGMWLVLALMWQGLPEGRKQGGPALEGLEVVSAALRAGISRMEQRVLMFSTLKGGEALERAREWLLKTSFSGQMSVMEYLSYDGVTPSRWDSADELAFRESLFAAMLPKGLPGEQAPKDSEERGDTCQQPTTVKGSL